MRELGKYSYDGFEILDPDQIWRPPLTPGFSLLARLETRDGFSIRDLKINYLSMRIALVLLCPSV